MNNFDANLEVEELKQMINFYMKKSNNLEFSLLQSQLIQQKIIRENEEMKQKLMSEIITNTETDKKNNQGSKKINPNKNR